MDVWKWKCFIGKICPLPRPPATKKGVIYHFLSWIDLPIGKATSHQKKCTSMIYCFGFIISRFAHCQGYLPQKKGDLPLSTIFFFIDGFAHGKGYLPPKKGTSMIYRFGFIMDRFAHCQGYLLIKIEGTSIIYYLGFYRGIPKDKQNMVAKYLLLK